MKKTITTCLFLVLASMLFAQEKINQFDADGKRHGLWQKKFEGTDQLRYEGNFEHGKEKGLFKFYKKGAKDHPAATKFFSDDSDLIEIKYYTNKGKLVSEGNMQDEKRQGKWLYYHDTSDQIMMIENYLNDTLEGEKIVFYDNGQIAEKAIYKNGERHGKNIKYTKEGKLLKEFTYKNGILHGPVKYYDAQGNVEIEGQYKENLRDGAWKYFKNGKLSETKQFPEAFRSKN